MGRRVVNRGQLYLCDFGTPIGHDPGFRRPAVVVSPSELNRNGIPIVLPVTRTRRGYPTHVELDGVLPVVSYAQCELIRAVSADPLDQTGRIVGCRTPGQDRIHIATHP